MPKPAVEELVGFSLWKASGKCVTAGKSCSEISISKREREEVGECACFDFLS